MGVLTKPAEYSRWRLKTATAGRLVEGRDRRLSRALRLSSTDALALIAVPTHGTTTDCESLFVRPIASVIVKVTRYDPLAP
jgi:hypothetical protein